MLGTQLLLYQQHNFCININQILWSNVLKPPTSGIHPVIAYCKTSWDIFGLPADVISGLLYNKITQANWLQYPGQTFSYN